MQDQTVLGPITIGGPPATPTSIPPTVRSLVALAIGTANNANLKLINLLTAVKEVPSPVKDADPLDSLEKVAHPDSLMGDLECLSNAIMQLDCMCDELVAFIGVEKS